MSRKYELVYVVSPDATDEQVTEVHTQVEAIVHFDPVVVASSIMPFRSIVKLIMQFLAWKMTCDFGPVPAWLVNK